jgi:hypothetical protein
MDPAVIAIIVALIVIAALLLRRKWLPDVGCRWCKGTGKRWGSSRKRVGRSGPCFFCGGSGKRNSKKK